MIDAFSSANWLAALVVAVAAFLLGALWFTPLFGRAWDRSLGYDRAAATGGRFSALYYVAPFVTAALVAVSLAVLVAAVDARGPVDGLLLGLLVGVGVSAAVTFTNAVNPVTPRPVLFTAVVASYHLACAVGGAVLLSIWR